jgi:hypothetical protein
MRKSLSILIGLCIGLCVTFAVHSAPREADLAHVAILKFSDETGKKDYDWVRTSLPDAINKFMHDKFEFIRTDDAKLSGFTKTIEAGDSGYLGEIAQKTNSDIIIFGKYGYADSKDEVVITSYVYHIQGKKIIGESKVIGKLDNSLFSQIDKIAAKSVENIYQFVLSVSKEKQTAEQTRVLVLVPTWSSAAEQKSAENEIQTMKGSLAKTYKARFLTLNEFYTQQKTTPEERTQINGYATARDKDPIVKWLESQGVEDAFIVFVSSKKVSITPVVAGTSKEEFSYAVGAKPAEKIKAIEASGHSTGMELTGNTTRLRKNLFASRRSSALHLMGNLAIPLGAAGDFISGGFGGKISYYGNALAPWFYPVVQLGFQQLGGKNDADFATSFATANAGVGYPVIAAKKFSLFPYAGFGAAVATLKGTGKTYIQPYGELGVLADYEIFARILLVAGFGAGYVIDSTRSTLLLNGYVGAGYRF